VQTETGERPYDRGGDLTIYDQPVNDEQALPAFAAWLEREMPAGTIIGDPTWWAPRILRVVLTRFPDAQPVRDEREAMHENRVNEAAREHGYDHPIAISARLAQQIELFGGENAGTLVMWEAMKALDRLAALQSPASGQAAVPSDDDIEKLRVPKGIFAEWESGSRRYRAAFARAVLARFAAPAVAIPPFDNEKCHDDLHERGVSVGLFDIPKETANAICAGISAATNARVDWHYIGGRVHIKALPAPTPPAVAQATEYAPHEASACSDQLHALREWMSATGVIPAASSWVGELESIVVAAFDAGLSAAPPQEGTGEPVAQANHTPPYGNCQFRMCDLPGQCRSEGKCHHPAAAPVAQPSRSALRRELRCRLHAFQIVGMWRLLLSLQPMGAADIDGFRIVCARLIGNLRALGDEDDLALLRGFAAPFETNGQRSAGHDQHLIVSNDPLVVLTLLRVDVVAGAHVHALGVVQNVAQEYLLVLVAEVGGVFGREVDD
jgi:hypothetical protein